MDTYRTLKDAFARYATGVTVVSCLGPDGAAIGVTVNSFVSVSLAPPLVLWCIEKRAGTFEVFAAADGYAVSVLHAGQEDISSRFATPGRHDFTPFDTDEWETGAPLLKDRLAGFDCRVTARHDAGDHVILVGEVLRFDQRAGAPLIYAGSRYMAGPDL